MQMEMASAASGMKSDSSDCAALRIRLLRARLLAEVNMARTIRFSMLLGVAVILSACVRMTVDMEVKSNDTVSGVAVIAFQKELQAIAGQNLRPDTTGIFMKSDKIEVNPYSEGNYVGTEYVFRDAPLSLFSPNVQGNDQALTIRRDGDRLIVNGMLDLSNNSYSEQSSTNTLIDWALSDADIHVSITLPGSIESSDGDVNGSTITWRGRLNSSTPINAIAYAPFNSAPVIPYRPIALGVLLVGAGIGGALAVSRLRRKSAGNTQLSEPNQAPPTDDGWV